MQSALERSLQVWATREVYEPVPYIAEALRKSGVPLEAIKRHKAPSIRGTQVARAWEQTPDNSQDELTRMAYREMARQTDELFRLVTHDLGCRVKWSDEPEPYDTAVDQARDLARNKRLVTAWGLGRNHPCLTDEEYARFRAVHDFFGHAGIGGGFDRHGEYQAWLVHAAMYRGLGAWAMSSEYRGVNSSLVFGNNAGTGKAALIPLKLIPELDRPQCDLHGVCPLLKAKPDLVAG